MNPLTLPSFPGLSHGHWNDSSSTQGMSSLGTILVVEDNPTEMLLLKRAWQRANVLNPLQWVLDGVEAISYLNGDGKWADRQEFPLPVLVLLDLKLPLVSGFDVLQWVRRQPKLSTLRVVMFSSSDEPRDINRAYELGTNSYSVKPLHFEDLVRLVEVLNHHWLGISKQPLVGERN